MKFTIQRSPLFQALQTVQSVVEKKNTNPILSHILCHAKENELLISATDLEIGIRISIPIQTLETGKITFSAKQLFDIVRELPEKEIRISKKDNNWIEITTGKTKFNVVSLSAEEFPSLPAFETKDYSDAKASSLKEMIDRTAFAVSTDATRYHLNGVFFEMLETGLMRMTATDGHRLSFVDKEVFLKNPEGIRRGIIIPRKGVSEIRNLIDSSDSVIGIAIEKNHLFLRSDSTYLFVRLIEGEYPDYRQVIPKNNDRIFTVVREELTSALKRVSLLAHEKSRAVKISLQPGTLIVQSNNPDLGEAKEELDVQYNQEPMEIGFNSRYLLDYLSVVKADRLQFCLKDRLSPGVIFEESQDNHTYVIMPMRI